MILGQAHKSLLITVFVLMSTGIAGSSQTIERRDPVIWEGTNIIRPLKWDESIKGRTIRIENQDGNLVRTLSVPAGAIESCYFNGKIYIMGYRSERDPKTGKFIKKTHTLWAQEGPEWAVDAVLTLEGEAAAGSAGHIIPLANDKYLVQALAPFIKRGGKQFLFGIFKKNAKKDLELESIIEGPFKEGVWAQKEGEEGYPIRIPGLFYPDMSMGRTATKIVLHHQGFGWFFIFDAATGKYIKQASVYPEITEGALLNDQGFGHVSLGMEATKDGKFIVATMSKEYAVYGPELLGQKALKELGIKEDEIGKPENLAKITAMVRQTNAQPARKWPAYKWWELDPETGRLAGIPTPDNMPGSIIDPDNGIGLLWKMRADGAPALIDAHGNEIGLPSLWQKFLKLFEFK